MKRNMKKKGCLITLILMIVILIPTYYNRKLIINATSNWLSSQTIPFQLVVNPKTINHSQHPTGLTLNEVNDQDYQHQLKNANHIVKLFNRKQQSCGFLSKEQNRQLRKWVTQKPHRYLYSVTPLVLGQNRHGHYLTVSVNRYDDTHQIHSYRYRVYYHHQKPGQARFLGNFSSNKPPKFVTWTNRVGVSGISKVPNFIDKINSTMLNSGVAAKPTTTVKQYQQLAQNIGLSPTSAPGLKNYINRGGADQKNSAITAYEFSDVPRETRFYITQYNNHQHYHYTLVFNRNTNAFTQFLNGIKSVAHKN